MAVAVGAGTGVPVRFGAVRALRAAVVGLVGSAVAWWLLTVPARAAAVGTSMTGDPDDAGYQAAGWAFAVIGWIEGALFVPAFLALVVWTRYVWANLLRLGVHDLEWTAGDAAAMWLLPGSNLVMVPKMMDRLWRGSQAVAAGRRSFAEEAPSSQVKLWWWAYLSFFPLWIVGLFLPPLTILLVVIADLLFVLSGVVLILLVNGIVRAQRAAAVAVADALAGPGLAPVSD